MSTIVLLDIGIISVALKMCLLTKELIKPYSC